MGLRKLNRSVVTPIKVKRMKKRHHKDLVAWFIDANRVQAHWTKVAMTRGYFTVKKED